MVADLVEGGDQIGMAERVADALAGHAIGLGEGAHADHARIVEGQRQRGGGRGAIDIGLVQHQQRVFGQRLHGAGDFGAVDPAAHRVVGIGDIDQLGPGLARPGEERVRILGIVAVGHLVQHAAEARHVVVEGRIGAVGGHHRVARLDQQADQRAEQPVDAFADGDPVRLDPVMGGQRLAQVVAFGVGIAPDGVERLAHRLERLRRGAEDILVRADPGGEGLALGAFLRFGPDEGDGGGQALGERCVTGRCHGPAYCPSRAPAQEATMRRGRDPASRWTRGRGGGRVAASSGGGEAWHGFR